MAGVRKQIVAAQGTPGVGLNPPTKQTVLSVQTYPGVASGMIIAFPKYAIPDTAAVYLQDILVDLPELTRRRGPLTGVTGMVSFTNPGFGIASCFDPTGAFQVAVLQGTSGSGYVSFLSSNFSSKTDVSWPFGFSTSPYPIFDSKSRLGGGALIGTSTQYDENSPSQALAVWRGGTKATYSTGTATASQNSAAVTGSGTAWNTYASPGMFLFDGSGHFIGTIKTVNSDTSLTLENAALLAMSAASYTIQPLRGINPMTSTGEITSSTSSTTVTGSNTKFSQQGIGSGTWDMYRARDWTYIGTVSSVTNDTSLTLSGNAAINTSVENYILVQRSGDWGISTSASNKVGFLNAVYAERQWYANLGQHGKSSYLWFSEQELPDCIDMSPLTGNYIPVSSGTAKSAESPIKAIMPAFNSLLILKDDETFALEGTDVENFDVKKVWSDGTLSGMSVQQWQSDVIYAGRNGIYKWDGTQVTDLTKNLLGPEYVAALKNFDPATYRMWSTVVRDHYILFIESVTPRVGVTKGDTTTIPSVWTIVMNMNTAAITLWTNVDIRGTLLLPAVDSQAVWVLVNTTTGAAICDASAFFDNTGNDAYTCVGNTAGPAFYFESKRYSMGDPLRRKLIKQVAMHYQSYGDGLTIDTMVGLGTVTTGQTSTTAFPRTAYTWQALGTSYASWSRLSSAYATWSDMNVVVWGKQRYKFLKHDNLLGFRVYQSSTSNSVVQLGPWQIGFMVQPPGRI